MFWTAIVAISLTIFSLKMIRRTKTLRRHGMRVLGTIVGKTWTNGNSRSVVLPLIQFATIEGDVIEVVGNVGTSTLPVKAGEKVTVYYDASNPKNFTLDSDLEQAAPFLILVVAWLMVAIALGICVS